MAARSPKVRDGLVKYPGGSTWFYLVRFRGVIRRGDTGCSSYDAAKAWLRAERDSWALEEKGLKRQARPATLREVLADWLETRGPVVGATHRSQMRFTVEEHFGALLFRPLESVTLVELERIRVELLAKPVLYVRGGRVVGERPRGEGGVNTIFRLLGNLWRWAAARDYQVGTMPEIDRLNPQKVDGAIVWPELVPRFLAAVDVIPPMYNRKSQEPREVERERSEDQRLAIRLQLLAGLREQEALGFRWEWMSWRRGVYSPGETKSRKTREIPLAETLLGLLRARWETQGRPASGLAMPDEETGEAHKKGYTSRTVRLSGRRVDVVGLHPHRLRATFATTLWEIGTPLVQISLMMGHTRPETTLGYIVQRRKDQAEAILRMAAAMGVTTRKPGPEPGLLVSSSTIVPLERAPVR